MVGRSGSECAATCVVRVGSGLPDLAHNHLVDLSRVERDPIDHRPHAASAELGRVEARERPAGSADCGSHAVDNDDPIAIPLMNNPALLIK